MKNDVIVLRTDQTEAEWYVALIEECKAIITEAVFTSRWALVEGYHALGERVISDKAFNRFAKGNKGSVQDLGRKIGISTSTLYYAMQFYEKYPRLDAVPEGKNITWNKLITKYLPAPKESTIIIDPPEGLYNVIVIDPPWPIEKIQRDCRCQWAKTIILIYFWEHRLGTFPLPDYGIRHKGSQTSSAGLFFVPKFVIILFP